MKYSHLAYLSCFQDPLKPSDFIHRPIRIALIAFSAFLLAFTLAMNGLSAGGGGGKEGKGKGRRLQEQESRERENKEEGRKEVAA